MKNVNKINGIPNIPIDVQLMIFVNDANTKDIKSIVVINLNVVLGNGVKKDKARNVDDVNTIFF